MHTGRVIGLVAALQFVAMVDFLLLMPLGPDLAAALGFAPDRLGWLAAAYTLAGVASGVGGLRLLDRFDRRRTVVVLLAGFAFATLATALVTGLHGLAVARAVTGLVGGPLLAVGMACVIDATPPQRRGQAMGRVMAGFSAAAIVGVPVSLELSRLGGWRAPFLAVGGAAGVLCVLMAALMPRVPRAAAPLARLVTLGALLRRPSVRAACLLQATSQFAAFLVIPSFSAFLLLNAGVPRERLGLLYALGGVTALVTLQVLGRVVDRRGPVVAVGVASIAVACGLLPLMGVPFGTSWWAVIVPFVAFMAGNAGRNVAMGATTSQVPEPHERAAFMALLRAVQDGAIAVSAAVASLVLVHGADGRLMHMDRVATMALALTLALPLLLLRETRRGTLAAA